jgi:hypothetical protein
MADKQQQLIISKQSSSSADNKRPMSKGNPSNEEGSLKDNTNQQRIKSGISHTTATTLAATTQLNPAGASSTTATIKKDGKKKK